MQKTSFKRISYRVERYYKTLYAGSKKLFLGFLLPLIKYFLNIILKKLKGLYRYVSTHRIALRPEFRSWLVNFDLKTEIAHLKENSLFAEGRKETADFSPWSIIKRKNYSKAVGLIVPLIFAFYILRTVSPITAQLLNYEERLNSYLSENDVSVGTEKNADGVDQVYYLFEEEKNFITDSKNAKGNPVTNREYVTWMESVDGYWQVFLYHIPTGLRSQLSYVGNNVNPDVSKGKVVWEGIRVGENWQIYLYDGTMTGPISSGDASQTPDIEGNFVVYSRKDINDQWRSTAYSISDRKNIDIDFGEENKYVSLDGKDIFIGYKGLAKKFRLNVEDLMILELGTLSGESQATIESIENELRELMGE